MICIGESIHIISKSVREALVGRDSSFIQELVLKQVSCGAHYIDLNIGPAKKDGDKLMSWLVDVVQEVSDVGLSLDTTNPVAMEAGLKTAKNKDKVILNSLALQKERLEGMLPLVKKYGVDVIVLLISDEGIPRDATERSNVFLQIFDILVKEGISFDRIYIDPIAFPVSAEQRQIVEFLQFLKILPELAGKNLKTTCGISNVSNGSPHNLRSIINQAFLLLCLDVGLSSGILDVTDSALMGILHKAEKIIKDGGGSLLEHFSADVPLQKTIEVLLNKRLYCHSWLET